MALIKPPVEEQNPQPSDVKEAQKQTGELLWLANRTRPDLCYAVSLMSQYATRRPLGVQAIGKQVRCHLRSTPTLALEYGPYWWRETLEKEDPSGESDMRIRFTQMPVSLHASRGQSQGWWPTMLEPQSFGLHAGRAL